MYTRSALILATLIIVNIGYANIPNAVLTKSSSTCAIEANGNPWTITSCFQEEIKLVQKYIDLNLNDSPISEKKEWQRFKKKISKKCRIENNDPSDTFNEVGYTGCIRDEYSKVNRKLLNVKE